MIRTHAPDASGPGAGPLNTTPVPMSLAEEQRHHALRMASPRELRPMPLPFFRN